VRWNVDGFRAGSITLAGDRLLILREGGEMVLAAASPAAYKPISTAKILPATIRSYPALANGLLYVRNEKTLVCLNLK
jgi:outer membrane protein assembly factor BamB